VSEWMTTGLVGGIPRSRDVRGKNACLGVELIAERTERTMTATIQEQSLTASFTVKFSGASITEICQLYANGIITRERAIVELAAWPLKPMPEPDMWGEYSETLDGSWFELYSASMSGFIDNEMYSEVQRLGEIVDDIRTDA